MKVRLNWALFLLTAFSYIFYPVWHLPLPWPAQWALLNFFILLSAAALYSPLGEVSPEASFPELKELWPAVLLAAAASLFLWLTPLPTGADDQSHAGPPAWLLGRATTALGLDIRLLPALFLPLAAITAAAAVGLYRKGMELPGRGAAVLGLAAAGNLFFFASLRFGLAEAIGRFETVLRYPPLAKFLYLPAYLLLGVNEAAPRAAQFFLLVLAAVYLLRLLKLMKAGPPPRLAYLLAAFFPTFFNLGTSAELEAGTVLFFAASIFHFMKAAATGEREEFLKCAFWTAAGFFYKQLLLGLVLSFIPALAALWLVYPQRREAWLYGLKTLAMPLLVGLPFILISAAYGIRNTALVYEYLYDPAIMTLNLKVIYMTCGAPITALLAASAAYVLYRRRNLETALLLYFSAAYYLMISATLAVGFVRHAQPFYIGLVLMLLLAVSDLAAALPGRLAKPLAAGLLALFVFQSVFAKNPYQRRTVFNYHGNSFPYWEAVEYFKSLNRPGLKIYAPMEVEPSHYYLAKHGMAGKLAWDRDLPPGFSAEKAARAFRDGAFDFLLLPYSPFAGLRTDLPSIAKELEAAGALCREKLFDYHGNKLVLFKPCAE
ncbi:MAG: hypothetical protein HY550_08365 [Elusimicrobia bacterium]|nr:hypothetical protein [Elusimicrobiota bacterium]